MERSPLTEAQRTQVAEAFPAARWAARRAAGSDPGRRHQALSDACYALCLAARRDELAMPVRTALFAARTSVGRSFRESARRDEIDVREIPDHRRSGPDEVEAQEEDDRAIARLPAKVASAVRLVAIEGMSQASAADRMGCSQTEVSRLLKLAVKLSQR